MAQKKQRKSSMVNRLRARLRKSKSKLKKPRMAFGRNRRFRRFRFRNPFRRFRRPRFRRSFRRSGGFSNRMPITGMRVPTLIIWAAIVGGAIYLWKTFGSSLLDKIKHIGQS